MAEQPHVSGLPVGPNLTEDTHDAIRATRERRKKASQAGAQKRSSGTSDQQSGKKQSSQSEG